MPQTYGFEQTRERRIPELGAVLHEYTHAKSGARLCWLERADENKSFCAAFRTLPYDDSGVFHILEHSVLCGSEQFPVKEPFVELMKGSLNTFLNALTYPDKTCYPVSSRNDQDFLNLMHVYLDAVFFPRIHEKPEIFQQEGWHYELQDGVLTRSGVVLNEMKGSFADPDTLLANALTRALFPDTPYRFVSGGDPEAIPTLTYEAFTAAHKRFYHPSNAYLLLDGSVDLSRCLALLDSYLSRFTAIFPDTDIRPQTPVCPPRETIEYPLPAGEPAETRWKLGQGYVIGTSQDAQTLFAAQVLCDVLCGSNHAPLCRAVLETGLAEDVTLSCDDECLQPMLLLQVQNFRRDDLPAIEQTIRRTLTDLCEQGLDREQIEASLASFEFRLRERDYGTMPRGLVFSLEILSSWLYGGDPAALLGFGPVFGQLRQAIGTGYYEALLRRLLLSCDHTASILMQPSATCGEARQAREKEALAAVLQTLSAQQQDEIRARQTRLAALQQEPDSPEALATIPHVCLSDLPRDPAPVPTELREDGSVIIHDLQTDGIVYTTAYFAADDLTPEELPYLTLLRSVLSQLPAGEMDAQELQKQLRQAIGTGYYEALLRRLLLGCDHTASILMQPSATCGEARQAREKEALAAVLQTLSAQQQDEIRAQQSRLAALQQEPDSPEALATIPHVQLSDLPRDPAPVPTELREDGQMIIHDLQTDGIVYTTAYFAADDLTPEELPYLTLLRSVLSQLPAGEMDAQELQKQLRLRLGSFSVGVSPITQLRDPQAYRLYATASCSALGSKLPEALSLAAAILTKTDFTNRGKLLEILRQLRDGLQQQIVSSGSSFAMLRASAALNAAGACTERSGGVDFYRWLCALEREFDARADACIAALQRLCEKLFVTARLRLSLTGGTEDDRQTVLRVLREALPAGQAPGPAHPAPLLPIRREGIVIPSEVSFTAVCGDVHAYSGALRIACRAASLGHYWNEIRVQGGAYGTGLLLRDTGLATAYTYRDPDCARSRGAIGRTAAYLAAAASEPQEANIIGAISDAEPLLLPRLQGAVADTWLLKGMTQADRCRLRHEMLDTLPEQLAACGAQIGRALDEGVVCVLGPRTQLEACGDLDVQEL